MLSITIKATSKKDSGFCWQSTWWKEDQGEVEALRDKCKYVFGDDWALEIVSQEPAPETVGE